MRIQDIVEYNKGSAGKPFSSQTLLKMRAQAEFETHFFRDQTEIKIFRVWNPPDVYLLLEQREEIIGYFWCRQQNDSILQIKFSYLVPEFRNRGIGTEAYIHLAHTAGYRLIHDTQLSDEAEKIWRNRLPSVGLIRGIWDRHLDTVYDVAQVGSLTQDGVVILDPSEDQTDPFVDYDGEQQRFFWITENKHRRPIVQALEAQRLYQQLGAQVLFEHDPIMYHRANRSLKVMATHEGF